MIASNFHTHTTLVDGEHSAEEMVQSAIKAGVHTLGFSEHCHTPLDANCSLSRKKTMEYRNEIARLKQQYAGQIRLLCGIEMDHTSVDDPAAYDYVIGSVHYLTAGGAVYPLDYSPEKTMECVNTVFHGDFDAYAEAYFETVSHIYETTQANIIGHFNLITKYSEKGVGPQENSPRYLAAWQKAMKNLAGKASLEINTGAMSRGCRTAPYPALDMLRYWRSLGGSVVINSDSHHKDTILHAFDVALQLAQAAGFTSLGFTDRQGIYHSQLGEEQ